MGDLRMVSWTWQEPVVALIVGIAVVSLYRHLRGMFAVSKPAGGASCHSCDDECEAESADDSSPRATNVH